MYFLGRPSSDTDRAGWLCSLHIVPLSGRLELADGGDIAVRNAGRSVAVTAIEGAETGNADGDNCDGGLDGSPDGDLDDVVW